MLTLQEINSLLKENFERQLTADVKLPENLAIGYKNWVRGVVQTAAQQLQSEQVQTPQEEQPAQ